MPELLLHIGTHKTGTTTIQKFLNRNRSAIREQGVWYPPPQVGSFKQHYAHHRIAHAIAGQPELATEFFDTVRSRMKPDERALVSAEPMYRHRLLPADQPTNRKPTAGERDAGYGRYVRAVRECTRGFDVKVLVMLRPQDEFVESLYAEQILATAYDRGIADFLVERSFLLDYRSRLDDWSDSFGADAISVVPFREHGVRRPIEERFIEWIGLDWDPSFVTGEKLNVTPSRPFVEYKRSLNRQGQSPDFHRQCRKWLQRLEARMPSADVPDLGRTFLDPEQRSAMSVKYESANRELVDRFGLPTGALDVSVTTGDHEDARRRLTAVETSAMTAALLEMLAEPGERPARTLLRKLRRSRLGLRPRS